MPVVSTSDRNVGLNYFLNCTGNSAYQRGKNTDVFIPYVWIHGTAYYAVRITRMTDMREIEIHIYLDRGVCELITDDWIEFWGNMYILSYSSIFVEFP